MPILKRQEHFKQIGADEKTALYVLKQTADNSKSAKILSKNGLRLLTHQEALSRSSELIRELGGESFCLTGAVPKKEGFYSFDASGELVELKGNETKDQKVHVIPGKGPLSMTVDSVVLAGGRFTLNSAASLFPLDTSVIVGVRVDQDHHGAERRS